MIRANEVSRTRLYLGLTLIVLGILFSLDEMGYEVADQLWTYSPLVLVAAGLSKIFWPGSSAGRFVGLVITFLGAFLLAGNLGWTYLELSDLWPFALVVIGLRLVLSPRKSPSSEDARTLNSLTFLGGSVRSSNSENFKGGDMVAFMGGTDIDLRQAHIQENPAVIDAFAMWGGIDIKVPKDWSVQVQGIPLIGAFEDETEHPAEDSLLDIHPKQILVVKGFAVMGGVGVSN